MTKRQTDAARSHKPGTELTVNSVSVDAVRAVARCGAQVSISPLAVKAMARSRRVVERALASGEPFYGINTGFGSLAKQRIGPDDLRALQRNLVRSHSAGVCDPLQRDVTRATMFLLCASLCRGLSGVRPRVAQQLAGLLNQGVTPVVPSVGSVGASGDLAPLAAVALVLIGEGQAEYKGKVIPGGKALNAAGLQPIVLEAKEGLALINGTHLMAAQGSLLVTDAESLLTAATIALAMSIDGCRATDAFLDERLYFARNQPAIGSLAERLRTLLHGSQILRSHVENDPRVQDPYSLRAGPTVLGSVAASLTDVARSIHDELGAVTDNPLVFPKGSIRKSAGAPRSSEMRPCMLDSIVSTDDQIVSGANFHGMPLALPLDYLAVALCHIAGISERRTYLMTGAFEPESRLRPFLTPHPGLQSGLMIAQYSAAACVNEMIGLAMPASVSNISTCAGMEDYNSFGPRSAAKARRSLELATNVVAIELLCAAAAIDVHRPLKTGKRLERVHACIRSVIPPLTEDRPLTADIEALAGLVRAGEIGAAATG